MLHAVSLSNLRLKFVWPFFAIGLYLKAVTRNKKNRVPWNRIHFQSETSAKYSPMEMVQKFEVSIFFWLYDFYHMGPFATIIVDTTELSSGLCVATNVTLKGTSSFSCNDLWDMWLHMYSLNHTPYFYLAEGGLMVSASVEHSDWLKITENSPLKNGMNCKNILLMFLSPLFYSFSLYHTFLWMEKTCITCLHHMFV